MQVQIFGWIQYLQPLAVSIYYTILASISMMGIKRSSLFYHSGQKLYMIMFGIVEIIYCQIQGFDQISCGLVVSTLMFVTYTAIGLSLGLGFGGSLTGILSMESITESENIWRSFQALGDIAFAYPFSLALLQIQGVLGCQPLESERVKKATMTSAAVSTLFYTLCASVGYAALGDSAPRNLLPGFGFSNMYLVIDIAYVAVVVYLVRAYQVTCQPVFESIEKSAAERFPDCGFITKEIKVPIPGCNRTFKLFPWFSTTAFVSTTTAIAMFFPLENVPGFWPLTVYYPMEMYIKHKGIPKWARLQILSAACLGITIVAASPRLSGWC